MRPRTRLPLLLVAAALLAGCTAPFGPPPVPEERLTEPRAYDWNRSANATYNVTTAREYAAVFRVNGSEFVAYRTDGMGTRNHVRVRAVKFRHPNGTVVNRSGSNVATERRRTVIDLPNDRGQLAYTADSRPGRFSTPVLVDGTHVVILPPGRRASVPIAGRVRPAPDEREQENDRVHLRWAALNDGTLEVRYYLPRDLWLLAALIAGVGLAAVITAAYVRLEISRLRDERVALGLELDPEDDDRDPPPGSE